MKVKRSLILPDRGTALVSTDIHGNFEDFLALRRVFEALGDGSHWVILGDVVHAPDARAAASDPDLYGYPDGSIHIVEGILEMEQRYPGRVHFVLGNHDHGHAGGPHPGKFYPDEVKALESTLTPEQIAAMKLLFSRALLAVCAPCGAFFSHGSPDATLQHLSDLDRIVDLGKVEEPYLRDVMRGFLLCYGQTDAVNMRFLSNMSDSTGLSLRVLVHGHDRTEEGFFVEGNHQVCLCIFGAPRPQKRYAVLDLSARYERARDLRDGVEIRLLYPHPLQNTRRA